MYDLVLSGNVVDPEEGIYTTNIGIKDGIIREVSSNTIKGKKELEFNEKQLIFPGFIDPHVHLRQPGWEYKEDFETGSQAAINGGVTTVGDMPNLPEPITTVERLENKMKLAKNSIIDILHFGGVSNNIENIKQLSERVPAFKIYTAASTGNLTLDGWKQIYSAVREISLTKKPITFHCEEQKIIDKDSKRPPEAEIIAIEKVMEICEKNKAKTNIAHISTKNSIKIINENRMKFDLTCEVTPHHLFFTKKDFERLGYLLKVNCPLREENDRNYLLESLRKGEIDMIATDHAPHTLDEKLSGDYAGMPGLDTYGNFILWLMIEKKIDPQILAKATSYNAAKYFGINKGKIEERCDADFVVLDKEGSTVIKNEDMKTKCKWSPFGGMTFPGKILHTIVRGKIVK